MNDGGGGGERRNCLRFLFSPPPPPSTFFCLRSNVRAITRLETLATQAINFIELHAREQKKKEFGKSHMPDQSQL